MFSATDPGATVCPNEMGLQITDESMCQNAASSLGFPWKGATNTDSRPQGCFKKLSSAGDGVFFNTNVGSAHEKSALLCIQACNEAISPSDRGTSYRGCQTKTRSGKTCQRWDSNTPHQVLFEFANAINADANYCRNFLGHISGADPTIWCYTTDPASLWEYCDPIQTTTTTTASTTTTSSSTTSGTQALQFVIEKPYTMGCPGARAPLTMTECEAAASFLGKDWKGSATRSNAPVGCYTYRPYKRFTVVHFNIHPSGGKRYIYAPVCKKTQTTTTTTASTTTTSSSTTSGTQVRIISEIAFTQGKVADFEELAAETLSAGTHRGGGR